MNKTSIKNFSDKLLNIYMFTLKWTLLLILGFILGSIMGEN